MAGLNQSDISFLVFTGMSHCGLLHFDVHALIIHAVIGHALVWLCRHRSIDHYPHVVQLEK